MPDISSTELEECIDLLSRLLISRNVDELEGEIEDMIYSLQSYYKETE